jgi:hypothetical protein
MIRGLFAGGTHPRPPEGRDRRSGPGLFCTLVLTCVLASLFPPSVEAATVSGHVVDPPPEARLEIQLHPSLDLSRHDQPVARAAVDPVTGRFEVEWENQGRPFWVFLFERFQPEAGPPFDLYLPVDLMPFYGSPEQELRIAPVDPVPLLEQSRLSTKPGVLLRLFVVALLVFGVGFGVRRSLASRAAPEGRRCAPLADVAERPEPSRREFYAIGVILVVAAALRLWGMFGESFDLLELSYTPGIGRPVPPPSDPIELVREVARLYSLDLTHPPGYHLITGVMGLFGTGEWLLRLPALVASVATCWLTWRLFRAWSVAAGLCSAGIFAVAAPAIYFGQDATPYALTGLVAVGSVVLLLRALRTGLTRAWSAWFGLLVAGFFCHYTVALLGIGEVLLLAFFAWRRRGDDRWAAAIHRATAPALRWAILPVAWCWPHFSTHPTVAEFTRLFADTHLPGRGLWPWLWDFWTVTGGMEVERTSWAVVAMTPLFLLGLHRALRPDREGDPPEELGLLLVALTVTFLFSVRFFYVGQMQALAGHVLYAFRWVGWFVPLVIGLCVVGLLRGAGPLIWRALAAAIWLAGLVLATLGQVGQTSRPDYEGVAGFVRTELEDRDALSTLPGWFLRGNLSWYLMTGAPIHRLPDEGEGVWSLDGRRLTVEAIHVALPFETTARNSNFERLWLAVVDEEMYGRDKFRAEVAEQGLAWARANLVSDGHWSFDRIELYRFVRRPGDLELAAGEALHLSSARTVMQYRTYPPLEGDLVFEAGADLGLPVGGVGPTVLYHSPMSPGCVDWTFQGLRPSLVGDAPHHWYLNARVPLPEGQALPVVRTSGEAQVGVTREGSAARITAVGGPCDGPPLELQVRAGGTGP